MSRKLRFWQAFISPVYGFWATYGFYAWISPETFWSGFFTGVFAFLIGVMTTIQFASPYFETKEENEDESEGFKFEGYVNKAKGVNL